MLMLTKEYWENRYQNNDTPWNVNQISTPIKAYFDQLTNKKKSILIPGCGNGFELKYLLENGFEYSFGLDFAVNCAIKESNLPIIIENFFEHKKTYDLIIEQTFFCAIEPNLRKSYVKKMHELLNKNGKLVGLLFQFALTKNGPPFGGSISEYRNLFSEYFEINTLETAYNSIKPRLQNELFFIFTKK